MHALRNSLLLERTHFLGMTKVHIQPHVYNQLFSHISSPLQNVLLVTFSIYQVSMSSLEAIH